MLGDTEYAQYSQYPCCKSKYDVDGAVRDFHIADKITNKQAEIQIIL